MESCYGCGAEAEKHPILGVINRSDVEAGATTIANPSDASAFVGVTVCGPCHKDPEHRTAHALKCHFVERQDERKVLVALVMAGSENLGS